jgi:hypothetical protein
MSTVLILQGLDGSNPLAFLAALGALRSTTALFPGKLVRLGWTLRDAGWRPNLELPEDRESEWLCERLAEQLHPMEQHPALTVADNLTISTSNFRNYSKSAVKEARKDRTWADYAAAFGCDLLRKEDKDEILDTAFRTMAGAGHQHFLESMRNICRETTASHLQKALFAPWRYDDPIAKLSLRWDPRDDQRYALRWGNPSGDSTRTKVGAMLGANRLAIEALPLFPTAPVRGGLQTTGFSDRRGEGSWWTWPIWDGLIDLDVCRSALARAELQASQVDRVPLAAAGIVEVFRSRRVTIGKIRSFTPAQPA